MNFTLWRDARGWWSVCDGPGPTGVTGYIFGDEGGWRIENDIQNRRFLDYLSAAASVLGQELPEGVSFYELIRNGDARLVATTEPVKNLLIQEGWTVKAALRSN